MLHSISGRANKQDAVRLRSKNHGMLRDSSMPFTKGRSTARALGPGR
jgi:hypothetical protein